ncbi:MAG: hypothetical protein HY300_14105, partial [Verrucomicrobia bacterium]|nr:hypothetical protein [Verrucomicrobiota bacterium]
VWRVRERRVRLLAALAVFALLMAMGNNGPLFPLVQKLIPVVGIARYPVKFLILAAFATSLLAAFGVKWCLLQSRPSDGANSTTHHAPRTTSESQNLLTSSAPNETLAQQWQPLLVIATLLPALAALALWWMRTHPLTYDRFGETRDNTVERMMFFGITLALLFQSCRAPRERTRLLAGLAALALIATDGLTHVKNQNPVIEAKLFQPGLAKMEAKFTPSAELGADRIMISPEAEQRLLYSGETNWSADFGFKRLAFWSNLNALDDVPKVNGSSTLRIREQDEIQRWLYGTNAAKTAHFQDFLGVSHMTAPGSATEWTNRATALPLATAGQRPVFVTETESLRATTSPEFDPAKTVCLTEGAIASSPTNTSGKARIESSHWSAHHIELDVAADAAALVVIAQTFYPPWKAYVDNQPAPLLRANHAFQALEVPAGTHHVRLAYEDRNFHLGCVISLTALALCGALWRRGRDKISS